MWVLILETTTTTYFMKELNNIEKITNEAPTYRII